MVRDDEYKRRKGKENRPFRTEGPARRIVGDWSLELESKCFVMMGISGGLSFAPGISRVTGSLHRPHTTLFTTTLSHHMKTFIINIKRVAGHWVPSLECFVGISLSKLACLTRKISLFSFLAAGCAYLEVCRLGGFLGIAFPSSMEGLIKR